MKKVLLLILAVAFSQLVFSQAGKTPSSVTGGKTETVKQQGSYAVDSAMILPKKDTSYTPYRAGALTQGSDGNWYGYDSSSAGKKWERMAKYAETLNWYNIKEHGADSTGVNNAASIVQAGINAGYKVIVIPTGKFKVNGVIQMKDNVTIMGYGRSSIILTTTDTTIFKCSLALGGNDCKFTNFTIKGTYAYVQGTLGTTSNQTGILIDSARRISIVDIRASKFKGCGVRILHNGYCCGTYTWNAGQSNTVTNSYFDSSYTGFDMGSTAEYNVISSSVFTGNWFAVTCSGGNNRVDNNSIVANQYGLYITQGNNGAHGTATGNECNHNKVCLYINGATYGFSFVNNVFGRTIDGVPTVIDILNSTDITFTGGIAVAGDTVRTTNCNRIAFIDQALLGGSDYVFVNVSGTAPTVVRTGRAPNSITLMDVATGTQLDITHNNNKVGLTDNGSPVIKLGVNTLVPDSSLDVRGGIKLLTGRQGAGKFLMSDAAGGADWANQSALFLNPTLPALQYNNTATTHYWSLATGERFITFRDDTSFRAVSGLISGGDYFIGRNAGNTTMSGGGFNIGIGDSSGIKNTTAYANIGIGGFTNKEVTTGSENLAIGLFALQNNTTASFNVALGDNALHSNTTGSNNVAAGISSLRLMLTGSNNAGFGGSALQFNSNGSNNAGFGSGALTHGLTGSNNTGIGGHTYHYATSGDNNTALGYAAGEHATSNGNVLLGMSAGRYTNSSNMLLINNHDQSSEANDSAKSLIVGHFSSTIDSQRLAINAALSINGVTSIVPSSTSITPIVVNSPSGFSGLIADLQINAASKYSFGSNGNFRSNGVTISGNNELHFESLSSTDNLPGYINYYGYNNSTTKFRDLQVADGKGGLIAYFKGSSGNVGIGISLPTEKLDIVGNLKVTGSYFQLVGPAGNNFLNGIAESTNAWITGNTTGDAYLRLNNTGKLNIGTSSSIKFGFNTTDSSLFVKGNVGIGTTSPSSPLEIKNNTQEGLRFTRTSATTGQYEFYIDNSGNFNWYDDIASANRLSLSKSTGTVGIVGAATVGTTLTVGGGGGGGRTISHANQFDHIADVANNFDILFFTTAGGLGIRNPSPDASSVLDVTSTTKGFLPPRWTNAQMAAVSSPATGLIGYNTDAKATYSYNGSGYKSEGVVSGTYSSGAVVAQATFTVTFGGTQPNNTYKVDVAPTGVLSAALFYVTNKTTTTFDVTYLSGLTGTVTFDYAIFQ